ncbi:MAG TPA: hypothetical protein VLU46_11215 [Thermoanaerobaculia bacterium]|nr:hypothetical protein [Thermoanaerobaculia bacterium]
MTRTSRFAAVYIAWIAVCAMGFVVLRDAPDPSRRAGRILANDAAGRAVVILAQRGIRGYEAVHVAYENDRWIVLCDRVPHTALREALVVELRAVDGSLLRVRKPVE